MSDAEKLKEAIRGLRLKAEDGDAESMFLLGTAHAQGRGVERDDAMAARWFQQASRTGHVRAKTSIGYLYATGRGVRLDQVLGFVFLSQAEKQGDPLAGDLRVKLRQTMSPAQLQEAEKRVQELG